MKKIILFLTAVLLCSCMNDNYEKRLSPYGISMDNTIDEFVRLLCDSIGGYEVIEQTYLDDENERLTVRLSTDIPLPVKDAVITINAAPKSRKVFLLKIDLNLEGVSDSLLVSGYYGAVTGIIYSQEMLPNGKNGMRNKFYYKGKHYESHGDYYYEADESFDLSIDSFYNAVFEQKNGAIWVSLNMSEYKKGIMTLFSDKPNLKSYNNEIGCE